METDLENDISRFLDLDHSSSLPSLTVVLSRLGDKLSFDVMPNDLKIYARFLRKCLELLIKPDQLVLRSYAHEQFARLILKCSDPAALFQSTSNMIAAKLAAVHHLCQAIISLRQKYDGKLWTLFLLLGESFMSLAEAYRDGEEVQHALKAVEAACFYYGSMPQKFQETLFVSSIQPKSHAATQPEVLEANSKQWDIPSACIFWARVWRFVGDIYYEFHSLDASDNQKFFSSTATNHLKMPSEVVLEFERLKTILSESGTSSSSSSRIFEYLGGPKTDDTESNLLAALYCFEETQRAFQDLPSDCTSALFKSVTDNRAWLLNILAEDRLIRKEIDKAEDAFADAAVAFKELFDPETFPAKFTKFLIDRAELHFTNNMLEVALSILLQVRRIGNAESLSEKDQKLFWSQMQKVLKNMTIEATKSQAPLEKLKNLYRISLRPTSLSDLDGMHALWTSP